MWLERLIQRIESLLFETFCLVLFSTLKAARWALRCFERIGGNGTNIWVYGALSLYTTKPVIVRIVSAPESRVLKIPN